MAFPDLDEVAAMFDAFARRVGFDEIRETGQFRLYRDAREAARGDHKVTQPITRKERLLLVQLSKGPRNPHRSFLCSGCGGERDRDGQRYCRNCHAAKMRAYRSSLTVR